MEEHNKLDYANPKVDRPDIDPDGNWSIGAFLIGLAGAPIAFVLSHLASHKSPLFFCAIGALCYVTVARGRATNNVMGSTGVILIFLWAPILLLYSMVELLGK